MVATQVKSGSAKFVGIVGRGSLFYEAAPILPRPPFSNVVQPKPSSCTFLSSLPAIGTLVEEMFLVCHVVSKDHLTKGFRDFLSESPSLYVSILLYLVALGIVVVEMCFSG